MLKKRAHAALSLGLAATLGLLPGLAAAADSDREDRWQFTFPVTYTSSERFDGERGTSVELNSDVGFGLALGHHFDERWYLGFEVTWASMNYDAQVSFDDGMDQEPDGLERVSGTLDTSTLHVVGQYNFLSKSVTPFVRASLGLTYVDSNIPSGPIQGDCWWDPWWGYICTSWQPTYDDSGFSYGAGAGVRAEIGEEFFLEAIARRTWLDADAREDLEFTGYRLNFGWTF